MLSYKQAYKHHMTGRYRACHDIKSLEPEIKSYLYNRIVIVITFTMSLQCYKPGFHDEL